MQEERSHPCLVSIWAIQPNRWIFSEYTICFLW